MKSQAGPQEFEPDQLETDEVESTEASEQRSRLWRILGRAAGAYLVLFVGLGLAMSALGVNPLANNALMPKILTIFVGLALLIALASSLTDLFREQGRNWLRIARREVTPGKDADK